MRTSSGLRIGDHRRLHDFYLHRRFRPGHPAARGVERRLRVQPDGHLQDGRPRRLRLGDGHSAPGSNSEAVLRDPGDRHRHPDACTYPHRQFRGDIKVTLDYPISGNPGGVGLHQHDVANPQSAQKKSLGLLHQCATRPSRTAQSGDSCSDRPSVSTTVTLAKRPRQRPWYLLEQTKN
jgi:hypothetical protein